MKATESHIADSMETEEAQDLGLKHQVVQSQVSVSNISLLQVHLESTFLKLWNAMPDVHSYTKTFYDTDIELLLPPVLAS